ncbi:MAG: hypothetical protein R6V11_08325 [Ectothiorhodospiraceae bacterium]
MTEPEDTDNQERNDDPRSFTDKRALEEYPRELVERWRREAFEKHKRWMEVMKNSYGKD